jgi:hypothetical protein
VTTPPPSYKSPDTKEVGTLAYPSEAKTRIESLIQTLETLTRRDLDQEVRGIALPVFDAVLEAVKGDIGRDNPVVQAVAGIVSPETIEAGEPIRAADALMVAKMLEAEIGPRPRPGGRVWSRDSP